MKMYYPNWLDMFNMSKQKLFFLNAFTLRGRTLGIAFSSWDCGIIVAKFNESFKMHSEPMVQQKGSKTVI